MAKGKAKSTAKSTDKKDPHLVFLEALSTYGNISRAAEKSGLDRAGLYVKRRNDNAFSAEWDKAMEIGVEAIEDEAKRRAFEGWEEPVWYRGDLCGTVRKFSDTLLIVLLKAHKPEKYRENSKVELSGKDGTPIEVEHSASPAIEDFIRRLQGGA